MTKPLIRILLVEDDVVDRMACRRALVQVPDYEFVLSEAETGMEGLELAHTQKPDCILLDYHLPDLNGLEFLAKLTDDAGNISIPVMMLTGADNATIAVAAMKRGARDYLIKDVDRQYLELLPAIIQRILTERRMLTEKKLTEDKLFQAEASRSTNAQKAVSPAFPCAASTVCFAGTERFYGSETKRAWYEMNRDAPYFFRVSWLTSPKVNGWKRNCGNTATALRNWWRSARMSWRR